MSRPAAPLPEVFAATPALEARVARDLKAGRVRELAPGLYTTDISEAPERLVRRLLWPIASLAFPGAVITDRTAFEAGPSSDGSLFLAADATRDVALPGAILRARRGFGPLPGDTPFLGLHIASRARAYLENMPKARPRARAGQGIARRLSRAEVEERLGADLHERGESYLRALREDARALAPALHLEDELDELDGIIDVLLGTREARLFTESGVARVSGMPYDAHCLDLLSVLQDDLQKLAPTLRSEGRGDEERHLPFFEAYFSSFIAGAVLGVDEAATIVLGRRPPKGRRGSVAPRAEKAPPLDARGMVGTFRVVTDWAEMERAPATFEELLAQLRGRHARLMADRNAKGSGLFRTTAKRAGEAVFVQPALMLGTLARGFELCRALPDAFQRAVFVLFLVCEVHPFAEANGRVARITMNAELVAAHERRIIVPTIFRSSYLQGLAAMSRDGISRTLVRALDFLQRYTLAIDFSSYEGAREQLEATNAFRDARQAEAEGVRLMLP